MLLANVLWPFHGAFFAQWIPLFLLIECFVLIWYCRPRRVWSAVGMICAANAFSTVAGCLIVLIPRMKWDDLSTRASDQFNSCLVAFALTVPLEYIILRAYRGYAKKEQVWKAAVVMNFITYAICIAYVAYAWRWGHYTHESFDTYSR